MKKPRGDSRLDKLSLDQSDQLDRWLFEENLSYQAASVKVFEEFSIVTSVAALCNYRQRRAQQRLEKSIRESSVLANAVVQKFEQDPADIYRATMEMIGKLAFDASMQNKGADVETLYNLAKIMVAARRQDTNAASLRLQIDKWQFDAAKACQAYLPQIRQIAADATLDASAKLEAIRMKLFGPLPEAPESDRRIGTSE